ncbi:MAG: DUF4143 domain-containing protein [Candidatus Aenigmatarchaeota archaeon]
MKIKKMRKEDTPLERLYQKRPESLNNIELLSIVLWRIKGYSVMEKSKDISINYNIKKFFELTPLELKRIINDEVKASQIATCFELAKRAISYSGEKQTIETPEDIFRILGIEMRSLKQEVSKLILMDARNKIIKIDTVSIGTLNENLITELKKSFKIYFFDLGLRNCMLNNFSKYDNRSDNEKGILLENFVSMELLTNFSDFRINFLRTTGKQKWILFYLRMKKLYQ